MEDAVEENMDSGFYLVDLDEANEMMLDLQASHLAKRWGCQGGVSMDTWGWLTNLRVAGHNGSQVHCSVEKRGKKILHKLF